MNPNDDWLDKEQARQKRHIADRAKASKDSYQLRDIIRRPPADNPFARLRLMPDPNKRPAEEVVLKAWRRLCVENKQSSDTIAMLNHAKDLLLDTRNFAELATWFR